MTDYHRRFRERYTDKLPSDALIVTVSRPEWEALLDDILAFIDGVVAEERKMNSAVIDDQRELWEDVGAQKARTALIEKIEGMMETGDNAKQHWISGDDLLTYLRDKGQDGS